MHGHDHDLSATSNHREQIDFSAFRGRPMLIVNTASKCGFTPQYGGLQALYEAVRSRGLVVIGFPVQPVRTRNPATTRTSRSSAGSTSASPSP